MKFFLFGTAARVAVLLFFSTPMPAQSVQPLTPRQQSIVTIAALTAKGDLPHLQQALATGLDAGLTVNEAKEVLVQLYAYCGFPRSLNGLNTLLKVRDERRAQGKKDVPGREASPIVSTAPKYERGQRILETLTGRPDPNPKTGANAFSPEIDRFLKEHLFADIFERDVLTYQERELATIAALVSLGGVEPMLQSHLGIGLHIGLTEPQLRQLLALEETAIGRQEAEAGRAALNKALETRNK
ncbi:carboxymuconolactone decarboxylase family protein [Hymenobacter sp. ASUV-10]|uniref:Carboxymuconolactone decarboxylase family protein n=1 Tax=Hymenobacter aranciens TaxID=3063996 RepID=A0ABT9B952_9BACT|nr:carboxymuconolactone decarboxylase family protein [Hymenobacter sp. ASUV-10]MDO7874254.1 carboxymuconolactone decarboxylase family protein [Hymenobacter sp. ASUV-10]